MKSIDTQLYCSDSNQSGTSNGREISNSSACSSDDSETSLSKRNKRKEKKKLEMLKETPRKSARIRRNQEKIPSLPETEDVGNDGISKAIAAKLKEAGLEHQAVSGNGNCGYIAASYGLFDTHNKWRTIRVAVAKYLKDHREAYLERVDEELINITIKEMEKVGAYIGDFALSVIGDTYNRPIEMWRRTVDGDDIETDLSYSVEENSILLWYNGQNIQGGDGNHYDVLNVKDEEKFKNRKMLCSRTRRMQETLAKTDIPPTPTPNVELIYTSSTATEQHESDRGTAEIPLTSQSPPTNEPREKIESLETEMSINERTSELHTLPINPELNEEVNEQLEKEQSLSSGSIPWENGNPIDESEIRVEVSAIPPVKTKAIASMGSRLMEWERIALSVGNPRRDAERLSNRMKELKKISLGLESGEDVSTPEDSPSEDECKGSDIPMKDICSEQEAHERYWALTKQRQLDERLEHEISPEFSIRGIFRTMESKPLPHQPAIVEFKSVASKADLTFVVYGGAVGEKEEEIELVKDYLMQTKIKLKASELLKCSKTSQSGSSDYNVARVKLEGRSSISETGLESAHGVFKEAEFWTFNTLVRLAKLQK